MRSLHIITILIISINFISSANPNELYDSGISSIINLNPMNFATQITNNRAKNVISFIHFYKKDDGKSDQLKKVITELDKQYEGMFKIAGLNCQQYHDLCHKENVNEFPSFMVYPPLPAPVMKYEGPLEVKNIVSYLGKFVGNKATEVNNNNIDSFLGDHPNLPKVILFSDKKNTPLLFKKLSVDFDVRFSYNKYIFHL